MIPCQHYVPSNTLVQTTSASDSIAHCAANHFYAHSLSLNCDTSLDFLSGSNIMSKMLFITATDTGAGKTYAAAGLLRTANSRNLTAIGIKPVASGCDLFDGKLRNDDALQLQQAANVYLDYGVVNPFAYAPAIAPHLAAQHHELSVDALMQRTHAAFTTSADVTIVEGFGGWHAPLNLRETMADYVRQLPCDVLMIVGIRLGCLNHAILTERAITSSGANCIGWIANMNDREMSHQYENIETLKTLLQTPLQGVIQYAQAAEDALRDHIIF
jgi:dethiobiotin synthetase